MRFYPRHPEVQLHLHQQRVFLLKCTNHATCSCSEGDVQQTLRNAALPQTTKNVTIHQKKKKIITKIQLRYSHTAPRRCRKSTDGFNTNKCVLLNQASEVSRWYSCLGEHTWPRRVGLKTLVDCQEQSLIITCTLSGHLKTLIFNF